ncbi:hypothetical protein ES703_09071 [subsurface metagenome]
MEVRQCPFKYCCYCGNESNLKLHLEQYHHLSPVYAERLAEAVMERPEEEEEE